MHKKNVPVPVYIPRNVGFLIFIGTVPVCTHTDDAPKIYRCLRPRGKFRTIQISNSNRLLTPVIIGVFNTFIV